MKPHPKPKTVRDPQWLKVVRTMPCINHGSMRCDIRQTIGTGPSEASHLDTKSRDDRVVPMCGACHRTSIFSWHHGQKSYCAYFRTTKAQLIAEAEALYARYTQERAR